MKRKSRISFGPGAASLILIVVILSMSVLGILAYMNARSDSRLSRRSTQVVTAGYELSAVAEKKFAALDAVVARCAPEAGDDGEYISAIRKDLPEGMEMEDRCVYWSVSDGIRTLDCGVRITEPGESQRLVWTLHQLTAVTEEEWD